MMAAWMGYFGKLGPALIEGGAPFAPGWKVLGKGAPSHATGYSIVSADGLGTTIAMTEGHPPLARGGGVEGIELAKIPGR